ncbi:MAG TPA: hypothetical protein DEH78_20300 [Solibacterales bacterium]|nr:hypothetical protein [Bryobacterales bacterium]
MARALEAKGLLRDSWHPSISSYAKAPAFVVWLDTLGTVTKITQLSPDQVAPLRRITPQNEKSFPGFNLNCPVLAAAALGVVAEGAPPCPDDLWEGVKRAKAPMPLAAKPKDLRAVGMNLRYPGEDLDQKFSTSGLSDLRPSRELIRRMNALPDAASFLSRLVPAAIASVDSGDLTREAALQLLCGKYKLKEGDYFAKNLLLLDVADLHELGGRVLSRQSVRAWNDALMAAAGESPSSTTGQVACALSGETEPLVSKMPQPNLPAVGRTYLLSMNAAAPCQTRYGLSADRVFPVAQRHVQNMHDALTYVVDPAREGRTFARIPAFASSDSDLVIAYLQENPDADLSAADIFAGSLASSAAEAALYEERTRSILDNLTAHASGHDSAVNVFAISKLDPGRAQVMFSGCYSVRRIREACMAWFEGARNLPPIPVYPETTVPSPADVIRSFKRQWLRQGTHSAPVPGIALPSVYALFLAEGSAGEPSPLLSRYLKLVSPLLVAAAGWLPSFKDVPKPAVLELSVALPIVGILLHKLGHSKERYMESREYLVGQYLRIADEIHRQYCAKVRKGAVPNQLAGNAGVASALQSPARALSTVGLRIRVYIAWADQHEGQDAPLVHWLRRRLGDVCRELQNYDLTSPVTDLGRAHLFLGYLANTKKQENQ